MRSNGTQTKRRPLSNATILINVLHFTVVIIINLIVNLDINRILLTLFTDVSSVLSHTRGSTAALDRPGASQTRGKSINEV
jgi:hypothetical protein